MHEDILTAQKLFNEAFHLRQRIHMFIQDTSEKSKGGHYDEATMTDMGYIFRETGKYLNEARKDSDARTATCGRVLCINSLKKIQETGVLEVDTIRGDFASATPDVGCIPRIPNKGSKEYHMLMTALGASEDLIDSTLVKPSFSALKKEVERRATSGEKQLPGIGEPAPEFKCVFRKGRQPKDLIFSKKEQLQCQNETAHQQQKSQKQPESQITLPSIAQILSTHFRISSNTESYHESKWYSQPLEEISLITSNRETLFSADLGRYCLTPNQKYLSAS